MKIEEFASGSYRKQFQYESFSPSLVNQEWTWDDPGLNILLEQASKELSKLNSYSLIVPDIDLFISMHVLKEANTSSRIEGTRTEMEDVVLEQQYVAPERRDDWQEVQNYVAAMNQSILELETLPLSTRLLRQAHATLMQGVRGEHKAPGEFRKSQNWIGGTSLQDAAYVPPSHEEVPELMSDLERFWHNEEIKVPDLIRIAISHYQFEAIHPFLDGNGRVGRLLITLYLVSKNLLNKPSLYLSDYLEKHRGAYYDALTTARVSNNLLHWLAFFLKAVRDTAHKGAATFKEILTVRTEAEEQVQSLGSRTHNGLRLLERLYSNPVTTIPQAAAQLDISFPTANKLIDQLVSLGILEEITGSQRNKLYSFKKYASLFQP